jgi:hypothetical protein
MPQVVSSEPAEPEGANLLPVYGVTTCSLEVMAWPQHKLACHLHIGATCVDTCQTLCSPLGRYDVCEVCVVSMAPCQQGGTAGAAHWGVDKVVVEGDTLGDDVLVQAWHVARVPAKL